MSDGRAVPVARSSAGTRHVNRVVAKPPLTFAIMELLDNTDSTRMKKLWRKFGFKDLSPLWAKQATVPTFNDAKNVTRWSEFGKAMVDVDADWYYLSGHHAWRFGLDNTDDVDTETEVGLFNHAYHDGPWEHATRADPTVKASKKDLFVYSSQTPGSPLGPLDNPVFARVRKCKGVVMMGCNTLSYLSVRKTLAKIFPQALIIGYLTTTPAGIGAYLPIEKLCGRDFFENPPTNILDLLTWTTNLNKKYARKTLAIQIQQSLIVFNQKTGVSKQVHYASDAETVYRAAGYE